MDAAAELGRIPASKHQIQLEYGDEQVDAGRDCRTRLARLNSQARTRTGKYPFPCSADHVKDWQPYPVGPYSCCMCDHTCHILTNLRAVPFSVGSCLPSLTNVSTNFCGVLTKSLFIMGRFRNPLLSFCSGGPNLLWSNNIPLCRSSSIAIQPPQSVVITPSSVGARTRQCFLATTSAFFGCGMMSELVNRVTTN